MANLAEVSQWENVIRQIENGEAATGGADGLANVQAKQLANRTQYLKNNYLPLTGGAMSGAIKSQTALSLLELFGGTQYRNGASLGLYGKSNDNAGQFFIEASNGSVHSALTGNPNGELTWQAKDLAGSAIVAKSLAPTGYIKYASGLLFQWGNWEGFNPGQPTTKISFPVTYNKAIWVNSYVSSDHGSVKIKLLNSDGFWVDFALTADNTTLNWFAIGY